MKIWTPILEIIISHAADNCPQHRSDNIMTKKHSESATRRFVQFEERETI